MEQYIEDAIIEIQSLASSVKENLESIAEDLDIEPYWVVEVFRKELSKLLKSE